MQINAKALERLTTAPFTGESVAKMLGFMLTICQAAGNPNSQFTLDWEFADKNPQPGDLIPYITLGLRPAAVQNAAATRTVIPGEITDAEVNPY